MFSIIGMVIVTVAILGGYLMEHGKLAVLFQPAELVIIGGAAIGTVLVANPRRILIRMLQSIRGLISGSPYTRERYLDSFKMLYDLFGRARKDGLSAVEADVEEPAKSKVFAAHPAILKDHEVLGFICDSVRTAAAGVVDPFDLDQMMEADMEVRRHEAEQPIASLGTLADSLPGLGIVAAVLGVCITMGAIGGPPEEIGEKVAAALVGTFLGILLCYGFIGPIAGNLSKIAEEEHEYYQAIRVCIMAFVKGTPPIVAVEMGRRVTPMHVRPGFQELEKTCRQKSAAAAPAAPAATAAAA